MKKAVLYHKLKDKMVECRACSWYCRIRPEQTGICGTRINKKGILFSLVYGKAIGLALDPVEKKPLYHFLPGSRFLSFGTAGCNFGCLFCQNWEQSQGIKNLELKAEKELKNHISQFSRDVTPRQIVELAEKQGAEGIAYTYNEPAIFAEFTHDTAVLAKKRGLKNVYVSNGFESGETFRYIKNYIDAINIDLKSFRKDFYTQICKGRIEPVKENIKRFYREGIETEVTTLLIPGYNDSPKELSDIAEFLSGISKDIPWHVSAFFPHYRMQNVPPTPNSSLEKAYRIGKKAGLNYVYVGNISDSKRSRTYCPKCRTVLITRDYYAGEVRGLDIKTGKCRKCKNRIYGVWL